MNILRKLVMRGIVVLVMFESPIFSAAQGGVISADTPDKDHRSIAPYFTPAASTSKAMDKDGFIQRWLLLEPINKPNRTNTVFIGTYVRNAFITEYCDKARWSFRRP